MSNLFNTIKLKKSNIASKIPTINDLELGELAINYTDGILYYKTSENDINWFSAKIKHMSSTAPDNQVPGELWWDIETGSLFLYYDSGESQQWVEITSNTLVEGPNGTYTLYGNLIVTGDTTIEGSLYETSDIALKTNVLTINSPLEIINNIRGVEFDWISSNHHSFGVIAQEIESILPFIVHEKSDGIKTVNYIAFIGLLIESIKELSEKINHVSSISN